MIETSKDAAITRFASFTAPFTGSGDCTATPLALRRVVDERGYTL
jgi:hypothetical protein